MQHQWQAYVNSDPCFEQLKLFAIDNNHDPKLVIKANIQQALHGISNANNMLYVIEYDPNQNLIRYNMFIKKAHSLKCPVLMLYDHKHQPDFNWLKQIKVNHIEALPINNETLIKTLKKLTTNSNNSNQKKFAKIISFAKFYPNSGAMTIAANAANLLAKQHKVLLLDFDNFFSPVAVHCGLNPENCLSKLLAKPDRIDNQLIKKSVHNIGGNLDLLAALDDLDAKSLTDENAIDQLIIHCYQMYDIIVIHLPFSKDLSQHPSLTLSDHLIAVAILNRATKIALEKFHTSLSNNFDMNKFNLWLNNPLKQSDITYDEFFENLTITSSGEISYDYDLMAEARETQTLATTLSPKAKFTKELEVLLTNMQIYNKVEKFDWLSLRKIFKIWK